MADAYIDYTRTDEAPALATRAFWPVLESFAAAAGVDVRLRDISLAGRILAKFPDHLEEDQRVEDALENLGALAKEPQANIVKLPNISASVPQLKRAVAELQEKGYALPDFPDEPSTDEEREVRATYDVVSGSAVNPVLREGNSDRRAPRPVKQFAKDNPHRMGDWPDGSDTHVATMDGDDFVDSEQSATVETDGELRVELVGEDGEVTVLRDAVPALAGEVFDASRLRAEALRAFLRREFDDAREQGILLSLHLKATMMKVSDPIIFGHAVAVYFADVLEEHGAFLEELGARPRDGLAVLHRLLDDAEDQDRAEEVRAALRATRDREADLSMVNSHKDITNLHVPSDVIIDASMPAMIRNGGQLWDEDDQTRDTKAVIPDSSYASLYQVTIEDCQANGAFDPTTMGTVQNVGLMAKKAEEYGSHDKTFEVPHAGTVRVTDMGGEVLFEHDVAPGDIWRMCQTKHEPIRDWVQLAVRRARAADMPVVFWLDEDRPHDAQLLVKVREELEELDTDGLTIEFLGCEAATQYTLERVRAGDDTISATGNVLRDYLTDLFPILELGTSAKMLSIVPLMQGGGLFETGAGGSAPKHVQQLVEENHLRWDSLGEYLALTESLEEYGETTDNGGARVLAGGLDVAVARYLEDGHSPSREVGEPDNRASHYWVARHWARAVADQDDDPALAERFTPLAEALEEGEEAILAELLEVQGEPVDLGGYFLPDDEKANAVMRPSPTLQDALAVLAGAG